MPSRSMTLSLQVVAFNVVHAGYTSLTLRYWDSLAEVFAQSDSEEDFSWLMYHPAGPRGLRSLAAFGPVGLPIRTAMHARAAFIKSCWSSMSPSTRRMSGDLVSDCCFTDGIEKLVPNSLV